MAGYRDLSGLTRIVAGLLGAEMVLMLVVTVGNLYMSPESEPDLSLAMLLPVAALVYLLVVLASYIAVGRWIYLAAVNAHLLSDEVDTSPGWAVGWYFVPIANLFMPYQAMREIWMASHFRNNWHGEPTPALLIIWWSLWLITRFIGGISFQMSFGVMAGAEPSFNDTIDIAAAVLNIPLCLVVIAMTRRIATTQVAAGNDRIFA